MKLYRILTALTLSLALLLPCAALAASQENILVEDSNGFVVYNGTFLNVLSKTEGTLGQSFEGSDMGTTYTYGTPGPVTIYEVAPGNVFWSDVLTPPSVMPLKLEEDGALYLDESKVGTEFYSGYVDEMMGEMGIDITEEGYYFLHPNNSAYTGNELVFIFHVTDGQDAADTTEETVTEETTTEETTEETTTEESFAGFTDVKADDYFAQPVQWAVEAEITAGTSETTFSPKRECSTAEILTFLWRSQDCPAPEGENPFDNVAADAYYADAAIWASEQGLLEGTSFQGDVPCTRAALVTYLWKLAGSPDAGENTFADVDADQAYAQAVSWAVAEGITSGTSETTFSPDATCTREQIVTFLYRAYA